MDKILAQANDSAGQGDKIALCDGFQIQYNEPRPRG